MITDLSEQYFLHLHVKITPEKFFNHRKDVDNILLSRVSFWSESFMQLKKCAKSLSWAESLNIWFAVQGGKFNFSAQDSDLAHFLSRIKLSDKKLPLTNWKMVLHYFLEKNHHWSRHLGTLTYKIEWPHLNSWA